MRESALAAGGFRRAMVGGAMFPFKATRSALNFIKSGKKPAQGGAGDSNPIGPLAMKGDIEKARFGDGNKGGSRGTANNKTGQLTSGNNNAKNAISGAKNDIGGGKGNANNNKPGGVLTPVGAGANNQAANPMVSNAVNNALNNSNSGNGGKKK